MNTRKERKERTPRMADAAEDIPEDVRALAGFDAEIVQQVESTSKALGQLAYPIAGLQLARALHATPARQL